MPRERFSRHWLQRKPVVSYPGMHHGTCITHVPWCMPRSLTHGGGENVPGIPGACATRNFSYLIRGPWVDDYFDPGFARDRNRPYGGRRPDFQPGEHAKRGGTWTGHKWSPSGLHVDQGPSTAHQCSGPASCRIHADWTWVHWCDVTWAS